ncbi:unnamed protein product [Cuscuta europaea]|uniref:Uncharacterized protein n=1 Tax=Cuscuta europaea TaxID=41803 RepID=A0A9P0Z016_CUSEU|nr:unnamed protein product [Cuscuta europaea]
MTMVHLDSIKAGLQFPLHQFYFDFFRCFNVVPAQFMPNLYRLISIFYRPLPIERIHPEPGPLPLLLPGRSPKCRWISERGRPSPLEAI